MSFENVINSQPYKAAPLEKAKKEYMRLLIQNGMAPRTEIVPAAQANGRVTAEPVYAHICSPQSNVCAMDGIALDAKLTIGADDTTPVALAAGQYACVGTGTPLPDWCNAVVMAEDISSGRWQVDAGGSDGTIVLTKPAAPWQHIRQIGEDICAGEMILPSFTQIQPAAVGAMIAGGVTGISVIKAPVVGIIPTGYEPAAPTSEPIEGDVTEQNSAIISAMLRAWGAETITYPAVGDEAAGICDTLKNALRECDIVVLSAGSPAEGESRAEAAISEAGTVFYSGLAIKPGRTAILGCSGAKPVLGVPGYPVSGIIVIEQTLRPIVEYLCRKTPETYRCSDAVLSKSVVSTPEYQEFVRVRMGFVKGRLIASPLNRGSGIVSSFMKADGIVEVPQGVGAYQSGEKVSVRLLRSEDELRRSLVAVGSHDPLLDELSDILRLKFGDISMGSAHVGSMGGLIAVRRGEAHVAGTHLLDEETGEYNISFIRRTFPKGGVRLVECVKRKQGLILPKGNPRNITRVAGVAGDGIRFVNRQKGSGTRILLDYLCRQNSVDTRNINGYDREEYTHTSVAAMIAAGSADVGLGIFSAAKLFDLEFIPVCEEQYDLLIPDHAWELPLTQKLVEVLGSNEFRSRLGALGGYLVEEPGRIRERL